MDGDWVEQQRPKSFRGCGGALSSINPEMTEIPMRNNKQKLCNIFFFGRGDGGWKQGVLTEMCKCSQRKQPTFGDATTGFPAKRRLRNERRNSILMTRNYPDLDSASDWLNQISHATRPIRGTTQIWVVTRHRYEISALVCQTSFGGETSVSVAKYRLFSQARANDE